VSIEGTQAPVGPWLQPLAAVRDALLERLKAVEAETLPLHEALGLVLAAPLAAPAALPSSALSLRDGVAVRALDTVGAGPYAPALLPSAMAPVRSGEVLPQGCDAVLPADAVTHEAGRLWALTQVAVGENARHPGQDLTAGAVVAEDELQAARTAGRTVRPAAPTRPALRTSRRVT